MSSNSIISDFDLSNIRFSSNSELFPMPKPQSQTEQINEIESEIEMVPESFNNPKPTSVSHSSQSTISSKESSSEGCLRACASSKLRLTNEINKIIIMYNQLFNPQTAEEMNDYDEFINYIEYCEEIKRLPEELQTENDKQELAKYATLPYDLEFELLK